MASTKRLGDLLLEEQLITPEQLDQALAEQKSSGQALGSVLVRLGYVSEESLYYFLALQHGLDYVDLAERELPKEALRLANRDVAQRYRIIPLGKDGNKVTIATSDPADPSLFRLSEDMLLDSKTEIVYAVSSESAIREALKKYYGGAAEAASGTGGVVHPSMTHDPMQDIVQADKALSPDMLVDPSAEGGAGAPETEYDENAVNDAPVIRLVNSIISQAVAKRASDIHLNPFEKKMIVRYRIDGTLQPQTDTPPAFRRAIVARLKVMAKMDIMEKRKAQDGRIKIKVQGKIIDLRVSTLPTIYGENVVMRILDQDSLQLDMNKLGFEPSEMEKYMEALSQPYGMILHTGPTGSGKTTTLYSALSQLNHPSKNLMTIEDPVEYQLPGVVQCQVNPEADLTFANVLRANLRQDPNVIMVGEIRDGETAEIAIKAALTGHLVLSTLHTNDAPSTVMRLVDMGIDPVYVGSSVLIVVAQRLIKRICQNCKEPLVPNPEDLERIMVNPAEIDGLQLYRGAGCSQCNGSGYKGRIALYEIMRVTPTIADAIFKGADLNELTALACSEGMSTLRQLAIRKWKAGISTIEEILRVTAAE